MEGKIGEHKQGTSGRKAWKHENCKRIGGMKVTVRAQIFIHSTSGGSGRQGTAQRRGNTCKKLPEKSQVGSN